VISSPRNPRINEVRRLRRRRERRATGLTTVDGPFLLQESVAAGISVVEVFGLAGDADAEAGAAEAGAPFTSVTPEVLQRIASSMNPRGPVAVIEMPEPVAIQGRDSVLLWDVSDPGNVGTIIRTAAAFEFQVLATSTSVDLWSPKVLRAAVGGHFRVGVIQGVDSLEDLDRSSIVPIATAADGVEVGKVDMADEGPVAFIIGNEASGVPERITSRATTIALPMPGGTESLNAAVTAGVLMYLRMSRRP
jgi:TrmH family RNA methyltransferase